ncbi:MAG: Sec-independent protein translocase subunit TatA [Marmoricola sp.]
MLTPLFAGLGPTELLIILGVIVLLFGAKKLPDLARGTGQALRIFKAETKALTEDDTTVEDKDKTEAQRDIEARAKAEQERRTEPGA